MTPIEPCICPNIWCPIHGEPVPDLRPIELPEGLEIPDFIRNHRSKDDPD